MPSVFTLEGPRLGRARIVHSTRVLRDALSPTVDPVAVNAAAVVAPPSSTGTPPSAWSRFVDWVWDNKVAAVATVVAATTTGLFLHCHLGGGDDAVPALNGTRKRKRK